MTRDEDTVLLVKCLEWAHERYEDYSEEYAWTRPFQEMLDRLENNDGMRPTEKQRAWVKSVHERIFDEPVYENLWSSGKVPRGDYGKSPTPEVLKNLPKRPPGRA